MKNDLVQTLIWHNFSRQSHLSHSAMVSYIIDLATVNLNYMCMGWVGYRGGILTVLDYGQQIN